MAPLPLLKIFGLVVKTLSKPLTNRLKKEAKRFQNFSNVCVSVGQLTHQFSSRATALASGFRVKEINPLPDEEALARGISFVSETFMFLVAGGIIVIEFNRSEEKNAQKAAAAKQKEEEFRQYLEERFAAVDQRVQHLEERIAQLEADQQKSILPSVLFPESYSSKRGLSSKNPYSHSSRDTAGNRDSDEVPVYQSLWKWGVDLFAAKDTEKPEGEKPTKQQDSRPAEVAVVAVKPSPSVTTADASATKVTAGPAATDSSHRR